MSLAVDRRTSRRRLDHVVMPVPSLEEARGFFAQLGFTVAPDAQHPFGTENACIFFADGSYIEPLAVGQREVCEAEEKRQNPFVSRDQSHRFRIGTPSFSGIGFVSDDAQADRDAYRVAGFGTGETLEFRRPFKTPAGEPSELGFRLAFTADRRSPDVFFFTCQKLHSVAPDRSALTRHANGTLGIARLVLGEPNPTDFQYLLQEVTGDREMDASSFAMKLALDGAAVEVATPAALAIRYGTARDARRGLSFEGIVLAVPSLSQLQARLSSAGTAFDTRGERIVLWLSGGPSGFIAFEEQAQ